MKEELIAYCGMNCSLCYAYQREKNKCNGCHSEEAMLPNSCKRCIIRKCCLDNNYRFCYKCNKYPCQRLKQLNKRYETKYHMSMIGNLLDIKNLGIRAFIENEKEKWKCKNCGEVICVHHKICEKCLVEYNFNDKEKCETKN